MKGIGTVFLRRVVIPSVRINRDAREAVQRILDPLVILPLVDTTLQVGRGNAASFQPTDDFITRDRHGSASESHLLGHFQKNKVDILVSGNWKTVLIASGNFPDGF